MSRLFDKFFPVEEEQETEDIRQEAQMLREKFASLIGSPGWKEFKARIEMVLDEAMDIAPGSENQMLYQVGIKDGIKQVRMTMTRIEREIASGRNE